MHPPQRCFSAARPFPILPRVLDVRWRLKFKVLNTLRGRIGEPYYSVVLVTQDGNDDIAFDCNVDELQDLAFRQGQQNNLQKYI
jgi:hypothetical protein